MAIIKPVLCSCCLSNRKTKLNPNVAIKFCVDCPDKTKMFYCISCDEQFHRIGALKNHRRRILVIGAGVRKVVKQRGDAVSFPLPLDYVTIRVKATIFHANREIYREKKYNYLRFFAGLSGQCVHIQILGARNLVAADISGASDAYVVGIYSGKKLGYTRVRPKTCNPMWINETFIVPTGSHLQDPRNTPASQRGLFRLEVYDYDLVGSHDFLGHVEIDRSKLLRMAIAAKQQPILLPLTTREFHGYFKPQFGVNFRMFTIRAAGAEALDMPDPLGGCNPYVKVFFGQGVGMNGGIYLGNTTPVYNTVDPEWGSNGGEFRLQINEILRLERRLLLLRARIEAKMAEDLKATIAARKSAKKSKKGRLDEGSLGNGSSTISSRTLEDIQGDNDPKFFMLFRFELWDYNMLRPHSLLGTALVSVDELRELCPTLPRTLVKDGLPTQQDQLDKAYRNLLNPPKNRSFLTTLCCSNPEADVVDLLDGEEDDDFWMKTFDAPSAVWDTDIHDGMSIGSSSTMLTSSTTTLHRGGVALESSLSTSLQSGKNLSGSIRHDRDFANQEMLFELDAASRLSAANLELQRIDSEKRLVARDDGVSAQIGDDGWNVADGSMDQLEAQTAILDESILVRESVVDETDQRDAGETDTLLSAPSMPQKGLCSRIWEVLFGPKNVVEEDENIADPTLWGPIRKFAVEQESKKNVAECKSGERGHLVLRLIPAARGNVIQGLDEGVRHMSLGETADLKVRYDQAYANYCQGGNIPARSNIIFRVELLTINGWGKIYMPVRVAKRLFRFFTWSCKMSYRYAMRCQRDAARKKRCVHLCSYLYSAWCGGKQQVVEDEEKLDDVVEFDEDNESSDEDDIPVQKVQLDDRMKKLVTPGSVHGSSYLFGYKPKVVIKRPKKKGKGKPLGAIEEEDEGKEEENGSWPASENGDDDGGNDDDGEWGRGDQLAEDRLSENDERRLDFSTLQQVQDDSHDSKLGSHRSQNTQRSSQRSARPAPPSITVEEAALLPDPAAHLLFSSQPTSSARGNFTGRVYEVVAVDESAASSRSDGKDAIQRPLQPPPI